MQSCQISCSEDAGGPLVLPSLRVLPQLGSEQIGAEFPGSGQKAEGLITCTSRQATVTGLSWKLGSSVARLRSDNGEAVAGRHLHRNIRDASPVPRCVEHPTNLQIFITAATHGLVMHTHSELCLHKGLGPCRPTQGSEQCAWGAGDPN